MTNEADLQTLKELLKLKGSIQLTVVSGSMAPLIQAGEKISVIPLKREPKRFDVIVFMLEGRFTCHYVRQSNRFISAGTTLVTRGIGNRAEDLPIQTKDILGLVSSHRLGVFTRLKIIILDLLRGDL